MLLLKILGFTIFIIIALVLLLITIILFLPLRIQASTDDERGIKILYKFLFFTFGEVPNPDAVVTRLLLKWTGLSRFKNTGVIKKKIEDTGLSDTVSEVTRLVSDLLNEVIYLLPHCTVKNLYLKIKCAEDDAALTALCFGAVSSVVYPLLGFIENKMKVDKGAFDLKIGCDYNSRKPEFDFNATIKVTILFAAIAIIRLIIKEYKSKHPQSDN